MRRRDWLLGALPGVTILGAQEPKPQSQPLDLGVTFKATVEELAEVTISVEVKERQLLVDCRDARGVAALLDKKDLHILQNDTHLSIERIFPVEQRDIEIGFIFDTSSSQDSVLAWQASDARTVLRSLPRPKDTWTLTVVGNNFVTVGPAHKSEHLLNRNAHPSSSTLWSFAYHDPSVGTPLFDAVVRSVETLATTTAKRRALVMFTDGIDVGSRNARRYAALRLREEDVALYVLRYLDLNYYRQHVNQPWWYAGKPQEILDFAASANGILWDMKGASVPSLIDQMNVELRREYRLVYKLGDLEEPLANPRVVFDRGGLRLARIVMFKQRPLFQRPKPRP
jgi:hypothetical protein